MSKAISTKGNTHKRTQKPQRKAYYDAGLVRKHLKYILDAFDVYHKHFNNKRYVYHYLAYGENRTQEIVFFKRNFMHLCGVVAYPGGSKAFYDDCRLRKLAVNKVGFGHHNHFQNKLKVIKQLKQLAQPQNIGITDGVICYKRTDFGTMIRTKEDLLAIGTVEDKLTKQTVPLSLLNVQVDRTQLRTLITNYICVDRLEIFDFRTGEGDN